MLCTAGVGAIHLAQGKSFLPHFRKLLKMSGQRKLLPPLPGSFLPSLGPSASLSLLFPPSLFLFLFILSSSPRCSPQERKQEQIDDVNYGLGSGARLWGRGAVLVRLLELTRGSIVLWLIVRMATPCGGRRGHKEQAQTAQGSPDGTRSWGPDG